MDETDLSPLLGQLETNLEDLEAALEPLLRNNLSEIAAKLPLLDKAKLHVLVTYAIESILFSYLRLNGINAKEHPVFRELTRVKQYFKKIESAETKGTKRENLSLDKQAAGRIIKHALAANDVEDRKRAEGQAEERARAYKKAEAIAQHQRAKVDKDELKSASSSDSESSTSESSTSSSDDHSSEKEPQSKRQKTQSKISARRKDAKDGEAKGVSDQSTGSSNNTPVSKSDIISGRKRKRRRKGTGEQIQNEAKVLA